jgi:uncharacterized protein (TIGR01244 family)
MMNLRHWRFIMSKRFLLSAALAAASLVGVTAQQVTKPTVAGVSNFSRLETTVACAGATAAESFPEIKKMGFASVINLRQETEANANIPQAREAAKAANLTYIHIPMNAQAPDAATADRFLEEISKPANQPAFIHCASANRAAAMWMIKRLVIDKWDVEKAGAEASTLGLTNAGLRKFAVDYAARKNL